MMTRDQLLKVIEEITIVIEENKVHLTDLDQAIGDGDHGINLNRGFRAVKEKLESLRDKDCGTILKTAAMSLISTVGGASGPLYGTAFMKAGAVVAGKEYISVEDSIKMFDEAIQGIIARGKASRGDKTMLDVLVPAFEAWKVAFEEGESTEKASEKMLGAAYQGLEYTKTIIAKKGRANYLGERSIGHQDPGATSSCIILKTIVDVMAKGE
ncbi:MAG: dihydroxyacetone kinase subunit [Anaerosolibacter sp.]|nr:dihydroxyacetone kinase subunit DhaL [Anaerosolibacter sp.]MDF2548088.1 dihydroxyacetone kinase subunit [Anaerosolibacter sp.]